jgi:hypothetical protein
MKRYCLWILGVLLLNNAIVAQNAPAWSSLAFDSLLSLQLPEPTQPVDSLGQRLLLLDQDSQVFLLSKLSGLAAAPSAVNNKFALEEYYDGLVKGFVDGTGSELLDEQAFRLQSLLGRQIRIRYEYKPEAQAFGRWSGGPDAAPEDFRRILFLMIGNATYVLQYWYPGPEKDHHRQAADHLLASLQLNTPAPPPQFTQQTPEDQENEGRFKPWLGEALLLLGLFLILALGYWGWRRRW